MAIPNSSLTSIGEVPYYIPATTLEAPASTRQVWSSSVPDPVSDCMPSSVFFLDASAQQGLGSLVTALHRTLRSWLAKDDVFTMGFLKRLYLVSSDAGVIARFIEAGGSTDLDDLLHGWGTSSVHLIHAGSLTSNTQQWAPGPYFTFSTGIRPTWRLFTDANEAFMFPVVPTERDSKRFVIPGTAGIPVPSRCFYKDPSPEKPLSGMRVTIKDNIDVAGVLTSAGNRAYAELYGTRDSNAPCVENILAAGAVVVGKVKTVQFASGESAQDWFDYQAPFDPRGDGYQDPGCSSAGSATACSAYSWIDFSIGTDTFGSINSPAAIHGLFGLRTSLGSVSTSGVVPVSKELDCVGLMTRDARVATSVTKVMTGSDVTERLCSSKVQLLYPADFFRDSRKYADFVEPVVQKLEEFLGVKRLNINIRAQFIKDKVAAGKGTMDEFLMNTTAHIQLYDCYRNCAPFLNEYRARYGKSAFADPYIRYKWKLGKDITDAQYEEAIARRNTFASWIENHIISSAQDSADLESILILPSGYMDEFYRFRYDGKTLEEGARGKQGFGFKDSLTAILSGLPFYTVPIDQLPYHSTVTERIEYVPGCIGFVGPKGSDATLLQLIQSFLENTPSLSSSVTTGPTAFSLRSNDSGFE